MCESVENKEPKIEVYLTKKGWVKSNLKKGNWFNFRFRLAIDHVSLMQALFLQTFRCCKVGSNKI